MISHIDLIVRIVTGTVLGGVIGYERARHGRPAGLRTHLLVAMAAATFMVVSAHFVYYQHYGKDDLVTVDSSRIAASVVSGIGFLAGGSILRSGVAVQGITTAAGLWLVTAIGLSAGAGMYIESVVVTALGLVALTALRSFEGKNDALIRRRITIAFGADHADNMSRLIDAVTAIGGQISDIDYDRRLDAKNRITATFYAQVPVTQGDGRLIKQLETLPGVHRLRVQHPGG